MAKDSDKREGKGAGNGNGAKKKADSAAASRPEPQSDTLPPQLEPAADAPAVETKHGRFDLDDPILPDWIDKAAFKAGGYPYDKPLKNDAYEAELIPLQIELVKLQAHVMAKGLRMALVFEGRDAAGKGGAIFAFRQYLSPRHARDVALPKPTETEAGQWYFQRYVAEMPTAGEIVTFDRSWYNRAGVEPVMGFCTPAEHKAFLAQVPPFESLLVDSGLILFKFWLDIGRETQMKRFHERRHNPLKIWKLSPIDYAALDKWDDYTKARDTMLDACHTEGAPWTVVLANDKRRARINVIRQVLSSVDYPGRDTSVVGTPDPRVLGFGPKFLRRRG
ncbi:polyphosphate kinase 2, PA0141 family [Kaistia soli DSM 19436]|uniref:ADP/GDP-polyphosphate phosphotransferase n=1 Tax=Kaistia soli DSM 19436 TaxID=1122133 RepID=A0A1M5MCG3_9HYPH|nr:polyphosphate kinase 2 [Kaistia soli]SHG74912.1 polyphosphate kinase 2, PA0141 family [Kaistia soli DSM 19436]